MKAFKHDNKIYEPIAYFAENEEWMAGEKIFLVKLGATKKEIIEAEKSSVLEEPLPIYDYEDDFLEGLE